jgi:hypothetical protein
VWPIVPLILAPVLVFWLLSARTTRARLRGAITLLALGTLATVAAVAVPRGVYEIALLAFGGSLLVVRNRRLSLALVPIVLLCCAGLVVLDNNPRRPDFDDLIPLPDGLHAVRATERSCGSSACSRQMIISGPDALTRMQRHLTDSGYPGDGCRADGWLLHRGERCATVHARDTDALLNVITWAPHWNGG